MNKITKAQINKVIISSKLLYLLIGLVLILTAVIFAATRDVHKVIAIPDGRDVQISFIRAPCIMSHTSEKAGSYYPGYIAGDQTVSLFDPTNPAASGCEVTDAYPFEIAAFTFTLFDPGGYTWPVNVDIVVYDLDASGDPCEGPGAELYRYSVIADEATYGFPYAGTYTFPTPCCVNRSFFIGLEYTSGIFGSTPSIVYDYTSNTPSCLHYNYYPENGLWYEWYYYWAPPPPGHPMFWVYGGTEVENCGEPAVGRCCYADPSSPSCSDELEANCMARSDFISWSRYLDCTSPCSIPPDGRCCYGDLLVPSCINEAESECLDRPDYISWNDNLDCTFPCPTLSEGRCCYGDPDYPSCSIELQSDCIDRPDYILWNEHLDCTSPCPPPLECPPNSIPEGEPTGCDNPDVTNGGCNLDVPLFSYISCGDTICGTSGNYYDAQAGRFHRDQDWYQFEITEVTTIAWSVFAEFPVMLRLIYTDPPGSDNCADYSGVSYKNGPAYENVSLKRSLVPGIYWFIIIPSFIVQERCNASYVATLTCEIEVDSTPGRCCYGDPEFPECDNLSLYDCWDYSDFISWDSLSDCTEPCPIAQPGRCCYGDPDNPNCIDEIQIDCENRADFISWSADFDCSASCPIPLFDQSNIFSGSFRDIDAIDLDKDNNLDIIVSDYLPEKGWSLRIAYGHGDGTFETPVKVLTDYDIFTFAFVDDDDLIDIVALGRNSSIFHNSIAVLLNQGNRSFSISLYPHDHQENVSSTGMAAGYFNNDAFVDIVAPPDKVYFGNNQGSYDATNSVTLPSACYSVDVGDFNNDGFDDIIGISSTFQAEIYTSDGSGNFSKTGDFDLPSWTIDITTANSLADYNHDGNLDVATVINVPGDMYRSFILIGFGNGQGGIMQVNTITFDGSSFYLVSTDVNRDNNLDLISCDFLNRGLQIYYGDEYGNFNEHTTVDIGIGLSPTILTTGDFDRDGNPDFVAGSRQNGQLLYGTYPLRLLLNKLPDAPVLDDPEMMMVTTGYDNVSIEVKNPDLFNISRNYTTIAGSDYWRFDNDNNGEIDETAIDYNLQYGEYKINITPRYGADMNGEFSTGIRINGTEMATIFQNYQMSDLKRSAKGSGVEYVFYYEVETESSIQPPNGGASDPQPTFDWSGLLQKYSSSESYSFQISPYYDFNRSMNETTGISVPSLTLDSLLGYDSVFYWRVRGSDWPDYSRTFAVYINDDATDIFEEYDNNDSKLPTEFKLFQNHPNPFNASTEISLSLPTSGDWKITIFNIVGQKVEQFIGYGEAGVVTVVWDASKQASGIYLYKAEAGTFTDTKKMLLLK